MILEFELRKIEVESKLMYIAVLRKGIQVGTLSLDKEPYNSGIIRMKKLLIECE